VKVGIFYPFTEVITGGGEKYLFTIAEVLSHEHQVCLISHNPFDYKNIAQRLNVNLDRVRFTVLPHGRLKRILSGLFKKEYDLFITMSNHVYPYLFSQGRKSILHIQFPFLDRFERCPVVNVPSRLLSFVLLQSYDRIICNSSFTRRWINKRCAKKLTVDVLYPPCDIDQFVPGKKQNIILSVGRYFVGWHNKKQLEMVRMFKTLVDEGLTGWEYHQAGSTLPNRPDQDYLKKVRDAAGGYPIIIHTDARFEEMQGLYARSKVYWHATGLDEDELRYPERMEHFGMSTVEAMAAGCVPVVINRGGQPEIVNHEVNGLLWDTAEQLKEQTRKVAADEIYRQKLASDAVTRAGVFSKQHFERNFLASLARWGV
jgi:glycosyltransferase involved in cell wall biosynthesis